MSNRGTLIGQTILVNVFLVTAVLFGATSAANLDLRVQSQRVQFGLLALSIMLALLANIMMLRRRFSPLETLINRLEAIDPAQGMSFDAPVVGGMEEVDRLSTTFRRLLGRIEAERRRSGRLVLRAQEEERKRLARYRLLEGDHLRGVDVLELLDQPLERREAAAKHRDVREQGELPALVLDAQAEVRGRRGAEEHRGDQEYVDQDGLAYEGAALAHRQDGVKTPYRQERHEPKTWAESFGRRTAHSGTGLGLSRGAARAAPFSLVL